MMARISAVQNVKVNTVTLSSIIQIGDNMVICPRSRALAVLRERADFLGNEGSFSAYSIFSRPIPKPTFEDPVNMNVVNEHPTISVNAVKITSLSSSAVFQIGSNRIMNNEARIKHIRQLLPIYPQ